MSDDRKISEEELVFLFEEQLNKKDIMIIAKRIEQRGRQEGMQQDILETGKNFIKQGVSLDIIAKATGFSKEEFAQLS